MGSPPAGSTKASTGPGPSDASVGKPFLCTYEKGAKLRGGVSGKGGGKRKRRGCKLPVCVNDKGLPLCAAHLPAGVRGMKRGRWTLRVECTGCGQVLWEFDAKSHANRCQRRDAVQKPDQWQRGHSQKRTARVQAVAASLATRDVPGIASRLCTALASKLFRAELAPITLVSGVAQGYDCALPPLRPLQHPSFAAIFPCHADSLAGGSDKGGLASKTSRLRHRLQESSIVAHMESKGFLQPYPTPSTGAADVKMESTADSTASSVAMAFVELGAGKGGLSEHLHRVMRHAAERRAAAGAFGKGLVLQHVLVDRMEFRGVARKLERHVAGADDIKGRFVTHVHRVREDLAKTDLIGMRRRGCLRGCHRVLFFGKHLCGPATDICFRKIVEFSRAEPGVDVCVCIATCCHHLLDAGNVSGAPFLSKAFSDDEVAVMACASTWASTKLSGQRGGGNDSGGKGDGRAPAAAAARCSSSFGRRRKRAFGKQSKLCFDVARTSFLRAAGFDVELVRYTRESVDDTLLLARLRTTRRDGAARGPQS